MLIFKPRQSFFQDIIEIMHHRAHPFLDICVRNVFRGQDFLFAFVLGGELAFREVLHQIIVKGYHLSMSELMKHFHLFEFKFERGQTLLHLSRSYEMSQLLICKKANVNALDDDHQSVLRTAIVRNRAFTIVQLLVDKGADANEIGVDRWSLLHLAIKFTTDPRIVSLFIEHGRDVNLKNGLGMSPLHLAVLKSELEVIKILVENGADVNEQNIVGACPLHLCKSRNVASFLIESGAQISPTNTTNSNKLDYIRACLPV